MVGLVFVAGATNGTTGMGLAQLTATALAFVVDPKSVVILLSFLVPATSGLQLLRNRAEFARFRRVLPLWLCGLAGVPVGVYLLQTLPARVIALLLGVFTLVFVGTSLRALELRISPARERLIAPLVGFTAGMANGTVGVSGPVLGSYLLTLGVPAATFAFTVSVMFFSMSFLRLVELVALREITPELLVVGLTLLPPAIAGQQLGFWLQSRIDRATFRRIILVILALAGAGLVRRGLGA